MSFERHAVQRYFETKLECKDLSQWKSFKSALQSIVLSEADVAALDPLLKKDAIALYIKALQTFAQALAGLQRREFAWPIVKMYYSVFYAMRGEINAANVICVKNGNIFYASNKTGVSFTPVQEKGSHQTYIKLRKSIPASVMVSDILSDNKIEPEQDVYSWMRSNRERVNYHVKHFSDPEPDGILEKVYEDYVSTHKLGDLFSLYDSDIIYCFDKDHATLAIPYHKLCSCKSLLLGKVLPDAVETQKIDDVRNRLRAAGLKDVSINRMVL